jgi:hypothetical protein
MRIVILAAAAGLLAAGGARAAEPSAADVRCITIDFLLAGSAKDDNVKQAALLSSFYFLGKVDGAAPGADLEGKIREVAAKLTQADAVADAKRCGDELATRGREIEALGERLKSGSAPTTPVTPPKP